jgi:hypothetical protein
MKTRINRIMCYLLSPYYYQLLVDGYEVERVSGHIALHGQGCGAWRELGATSLIGQRTNDWLWLAWLGLSEVRL